MWLFTKQGFFSVVATADDKFQVRARVLDDLLNLGFVDSDVIESGHADYQFRVVISRDAWSALSQRLSDAIDYPNFKDAVEDGQRARLYSSVWNLVRRGLDTRK